MTEHRTRSALRPAPSGLPTEPAQGPAGLYVHVPLCRSKCRYCGFYSVVRPGAASRWLRSVAAELEALVSAWPAFDTCYLGGGTPSVLGDDELERLVETVRGSCLLADEVEITLEANPGDVSLERARRWRALGCRRVSLGVQSFCDDELAWLGRRHDATQALRAIEALRQAGVDSVGIDLVQGLPDQPLANRFRSLTQALALEPEHLSCYELSVEPGTPLALDVEAGRAVLPDDDAAAVSFLAVSAWLVERGYEHYEVSNFARGRAHRSRHNSKYWRHVPYLGLGPAAHSFDGRARWANVRSLARYDRAWTEGHEAVAHREVLSNEQLRWERVLLGLRTSDGCAQADVLGQPGVASALVELVVGGWLTESAERIVPTARGMLAADAVARRLLLGNAGAVSHDGAATTGEDLVRQRLPEDAPSASDGVCHGASPPGR